MKISILAFILGLTFVVAFGDDNDSKKKKELSLDDLDYTNYSIAVPVPGDYIAKYGWIAIISQGNDTYLKEYKDTKDFKKACVRNPRLAFYPNPELKGPPAIEFKDEGVFINGVLFSKHLLLDCIEYAPGKEFLGPQTRASQASYEQAYTYLISSKTVDEYKIRNVIYFEWIKGKVAKWKKAGQHSPDLYFSLDQLPPPKIEWLDVFIDDYLRVKTEPKMHYGYYIRYPDHEWHENFRKDDPSYAIFYDKFKKCIAESNFECITQQLSNNFYNGTLGSLNQLLYEEKKYPGTYPNLLVDIPQKPRNFVIPGDETAYDYKDDDLYNYKMNQPLIGKGNGIYTEKFLRYVADKLKYCFRPDLTSFTVKNRFTPDEQERRVTVTAYFKSSPQNRLKRVYCEFSKYFHPKSTPWLLDEFSFESY